MASLLQHFFSNNAPDFLRGNKPELDNNKELLDRLTISKSPGGLKYLILTTPGNGPEHLLSEEALLDKNGMPKKFAV